MANSEPPSLVPRFASFQPQQSLAPSSDERPLDKSKHARRSESPWRYHDQDRARGHSRNRQTEGKRHRKHEERRLGAGTEDNRTPAKDDPLEDNRASFIIDKIGDQGNLRYGRPNAYDVPRFYRAGMGNVLGVSRVYKIDREASVETNALILLASFRSSKSQEKYAFHRSEKLRPQLVRPMDGKQFVIEHDLNYVPLVAPKDLTLGVDNSDNEGWVDYRSIEGKREAPGHSNYLSPGNVECLESDGDGAQAMIYSTFNEDSEYQTLTKALSKAVADDQRNPEAWLALIEHQENAFSHSIDNARRTTDAERKSISDLKIHLITKAIAAVGNSSVKRLYLQCMLMKEGAKIWDFKTQSQRWKVMCQDNQQSLDLWRLYFNFKQCTFHVFRFEEVRDMYVERIRHLMGTLRLSTEAGPRSIIVQDLIYTTLRVTILIREAGFVELAVAIWQAILEATFRRPIGKPFDMPSLQAFWEAEVPRIGEEGALGWAAFEANNECMIEPDVRTDEAFDVGEIEELFQKWFAVEVGRAKASRLPARTMDNVAEDDPYRVILWSDINKFIFTLPVDDGQAPFLLVDAFLMFCGLPPIPSTKQRISTEWWREAIIRGSHIGDGYFMKKDEVGLSPGFESSSPFAPILTNCCPSSELAFQGYNSNSLLSWTSVHKQGSTASSQDPNSIGPIQFTWVRAALEVLVEEIGTEEAAEYWLAFELHNGSSSIKRTAKNMIRRYPDCLRLYNAYALAESTKGNKEASKNIINAALGVRPDQNVPPDRRLEEVLLYRSLAWLHMKDGDYHGVLNTLLDIPVGNITTSKEVVASPTSMLRTREYLINMRDYCFQASKDEIFLGVAYAECSMLLAYVDSICETQVHPGISHALQNFKSTMSTWQGKMTANDETGQRRLELLCQSSARLMSHHIRTSRSYRPALIREHLLEYLAMFPQNTILLDLFMYNERRLRVDDRVRSFLRSSTLASDNVHLSSHLFSIRYEMRAGNVHSVRAAFENALDDSLQSKSNAGLWRLYILFCLENREYRSLTKEVFYRGMRFCPWQKEYLLTAYELLKSIMTQRELRDIHRMMTEKGLRLHVTEEEVEQWADMDS